MNENVRGSISPMLTPQYGQALLWEYICSRLPAATIASPPEASTAVCTASNSLDLSDFSAIILSTTISMLCHCWRSSGAISSSRWYMVPSTLTREYPSLPTFDMAAAWVPFFLLMTGASTRMSSPPNSLMTESQMVSTDWLDIWRPHMWQ